MVKLDPRAAAKGGMPHRIPVPKGEVPSIERRGLERDRVAPWIEQFLKRFPGSPEAPALRSALDKARLWDAAAARLKTGDWAAAGTVLEKILAVDPDDPSAHFNLAAVRRNTGRPEDALEHYERARAVFDDEGLFFANRGRTLQELGRKKDAIADLRRALKMMPGDEFVLGRLAELGEMVEIYGDAADPGSRSYISREDYARACRADLRGRESDFDYLRQAAHRFALEQQPELGLEASGLAAKLKPESPLPWLTMGISLFLLDRLKDAAESLRRHLELDPKSAYGWANLAKVQFALKEPERAVESLWKAVEIDSNLRDPIETLFLRPGMEAEAAESLERFIEKFPGSWAARAVLGALRFKQKNFNGAIEACDRALALGADDETVAAYLSDLLRWGLVRDAVRVADSLGEIDRRSAEVRWHAAAALQAAGRAADARRILDRLASDPAVHPRWRLRART